jgi:putative spermidine/putrescine transport system permease protein
VLSPAIFGTLGILFANAMGAYATAYALVGGNYNLLAVRIGSLVAGDVVTQPEMGSTLAVLLALSTLLAVFLNQWMVRRMEGFGGKGPVRQERRSGLSKRRWPAVQEEAGR